MAYDELTNLGSAFGVAAAGSGASPETAQLAGTSGALAGSLAASHLEEKQNKKYGSKLKKLIAVHCDGKKGEKRKKCVKKQKNKVLQEKAEKDSKANTYAALAGLAGMAAGAYYGGPSGAMLGQQAAMAGTKYYLS